MERLPTRILLATDGSECAEAAGRVAVDLANRSGAELDVVHAFEFVPAREYAGVALRLRSPAEFAKQGQRLLDEQVGRIGQMRARLPTRGSARAHRWTRSSAGPRPRAPTSWSSAAGALAA
jgi:nucleotide-binding universal stress UspA family protein